MQVSELFEGLLENLKVGNRPPITARRDEITKALNREFRQLNSSTDNQLMVGSYGRDTAIRGVSDLDMLYMLPASDRDHYKGETGPRRVLSRVREALSARYPQTEIRTDQCVVSVQFQDFRFEVQPVFENEDGSFPYPDTHAKAWKTTRPREEIAAIRDCDEITQGNLRNLCKLTRAWKNEHGVAMGGLLIDTLAYNLIQSTIEYSEATTASYDLMVRDFFKFLSEQEDHEYYAALGSGQHVRLKHQFQKKAKDAYDLCLKAIDSEGEPSMLKEWKAVFGRSVPKPTAIKASRLCLPYRNTEEFIEDLYPVDIRYDLRIDCEVTQDGFRPTRLRRLLAEHKLLRPRKSLVFNIESCDVPGPYSVKWKVLNRGSEAERRDEIRGQIVEPNSRQGRRETTNFQGNHYVECYIVKGGVIVARDQIRVPIHPE